MAGIIMLSDDVFMQSSWEGVVDQAGRWILDLVARLLVWLEPYMSWGIGYLREGSVVGVGLAAVAGVALGLTPATYLMMPVVVGCTAGGGSGTRLRASWISAAFVLGMSTTYMLLGAAFGFAGLALMNLLNRSVWLWYGLLAPFLLVMGLRLLGLVRFELPLFTSPDPEKARRGMLGAYLLGLPSGLAGCPSCALILPSALAAVAASGNPFVGALTMLALGLGQGAVLVVAGTFGGSLVGGKGGLRTAYRLAVEKALGLLLLVSGLYFAWRAGIWLL